MRRGGKNPNANPGVRPIRRIELNEKISRGRYILIFSLIAVALIAFGVGVFSYFHTDDGWTRITPSYATGDTSADELFFYYELGASEKSANTENRELSRRYTELCHEAYVIFSADRSFDGVLNLNHVNANAGETVSVEPALYAALKTACEQGGRWIYAAPYYDAYRNLFTAPEDAFAAEQDPYRDEIVSAHFAEIATFVGDEAHIRLEFLEDNRLRLVISDAYRAFAEQNGIEQYIDLYWAKNAFVVDYIADALQSGGYVNGYLASYDGFTRNLDPRQTEYGLNVYAWHEGQAYAAAQYAYRGGTAMVSLRAFPIGAADERYYTYRNGEIRHGYVDETDGFSRASADALVAYADDVSCADVLFSILHLYVAEDMDAEALTALADAGVYAIVSDGTRIVYTEEDASITLNSFDGVTFSKQTP